MGLSAWCDARLLEAGEPTDNAFIEAFNGRFRAECLNAHWFLTLADAKEKMEDWRKYYDEERPHQNEVFDCCASSKVTADVNCPSAITNS